MKSAKNMPSPDFSYFTDTIDLIIMWVSGKQKRRTWFVMIVLLYLMSWVSMTGRHISPYHGVCCPQGRSPLSFHGRAAKMNEEGAYKGLSKLGSRPPSCYHKCGGCNPCEAIQVPSNTHHLDIQYANYEPEGWKCKCGTSFFNP